MTKYPNREALRKAHDIYRDAMRQFIVRCLKRVQGERVEDLICNSLDDWEKEQFKQDLQRYESPDASIDIDHFPKIIKRCWSRNRAFRQEFGSNSKIQYKTGTIVESRNFWAHPGLEDVELAHTQANLTLVAEVLGEIKSQDAKQAVEAIRDQLFSDEVEEHPAEVENAALKENLADMTKQLDAAKAKKTDLEKQVKTKSDRLEEVEAEWLACDERLETVSTQLKIAVAGKTVAEERLSDISNRLQEAERENAAYQKRIETIPDQLEAANAEKTKYGKALKAASNQLAALRSVNAQLEERLETTSIQLEDVEAELTACKKDLARPSRQLVDGDKRNTEDEGSSGIKEWRRKIWKQLCDYAAQKDTPVRFHKPGSAHYLNVSRSLIDLTGFNMQVWLGRGNREIAIRLYMSKQNFYILEKQRQEIEQEFCESLEWEKLPQRRDSRISLRKDIIDPTDESDWQNQHEWIVSKIEKFHERFNAVFLPRLQEPIGWKK